MEKSRVTSSQQDAQLPASACELESDGERDGPRNVGISATIKAKNEEHQIGHAIKSLEGFADEVIVINDMSEDSTAEVARSLGARVIDAASCDGMIDALDRIGFEQVRGDWILRIDADERLNPSLGKELIRIIGLDTVDGVRFARKNYLFGDWLRYGGWFAPNQLRFFRANAWDRDWVGTGLHSQVPVRGRILTLPADERFATDHFDYRNTREFVERSIKGYAETEARHKHSKGEVFRSWSLLWRPLRIFVGRYLVRQGFRDGWRGLLAALLLAAYEGAIMWRLRRLTSGSRHTP